MKTPWVVRHPKLKIAYSLSLSPKSSSLFLKSNRRFNIFSYVSCVRMWVTCVRTKRTCIQTIRTYAQSCVSYVRTQYFGLSLFFQSLAVFSNFYNWESLNQSQRMLHFFYNPALFFENLPPSTSNYGAISI